tara:strand:+ start:348 stop:1820 length:1473 start_codon:yes stop_codon:yes gene_type:complete
MKIKFLINNANDSSEFSSVTFLYTTTNKRLVPYIYTVSRARNSITNNVIVPYQYVAKVRRNTMNDFGEFVIRTSRLDMNSGNRSKLDPILDELSRQLKMYLFASKSSDNSNTPFTSILSRKYRDGTTSIYFSRTVYGTFTLNNVPTSKKDLLTNLSKIIIRATICDTSEVLESYIDKVINYPSNVLYALENRTPYDFYYEGVRQKVRINTKLIGDKEVALEISDGVWGVLSVKDMNVFINTFKNQSARSKKWNRITPRRLWLELIGTECSEAQLKLMIAWLMQNRTQDMVNRRAEELLYSLNDNAKMSYIPNMCIQTNLSVGFDDQDELSLVEFKYKNAGHKAVIVKGILYDWLLISKMSNNNLSNRMSNQMVDTYIIGKLLNEGNSVVRFNMFNKESNKMDTIRVNAVSLCIDNLQNNSSLGDQLSTRAYIAMNDKSVMENNMIHTLPKKSYYDDDPTESKRMVRLSDEEFNGLISSAKVRSKEVSGSE